MTKKQEAFIIDTISEWDLYPSEINEIYRLQQDKNLYWRDVDLSGAIYPVSDEDFARIKEIREMGFVVDDNKWKTIKLTQDWNTDRYINKAKEVQLIWDEVIIEMLENYIEINFDLLKERVETDTDKWK